MATKDTQSAPPVREYGSVDVESAVSAAMIASGIGSVTLGLMVIGSELSSGLKDFLTWTDGVGPLSGKTGVAVIAFVVSWFLLHAYVGNRPMTLRNGFSLAIVLVGLGLLMTFPPIFLLFE